MLFQCSLRAISDRTVKFFEIIWTASSPRKTRNDQGSSLLAKHPFYRSKFDLFLNL
jgi:hypothetical protein